MIKYLNLVLIIIIFALFLYLFNKNQNVYEGYRDAEVFIGPIPNIEKNDKNNKNEILDNNFALNSIYEVGKIDYKNKNYNGYYNTYYANNYPGYYSDYFY